MRLGSKVSIRAHVRYKRLTNAPKLRNRTTLKKKKKENKKRKPKKKKKKEVFWTSWMKIKINEQVKEAKTQFCYFFVCCCNTVRFFLVCAQSAAGHLVRKHVLRGPFFLLFFLLFLRA